jgi:hypothetical protein
LRRKRNNSAKVAALLESRTVREKRGELLGCLKGWLGGRYQHNEETT